MKTVLSYVKNFLVSEDGPTGEEYAVILALAVLVCLMFVRTFAASP